MRVGIVVDGVSEFSSLASIYSQLSSLSGNELLRPIRAPIAPLAPPGAIARQCSKGIKQLIGRKADQVIVLFDRETRNECSGEIATAVENALSQGGFAARVVLKDRTFENWLVADISAVEKVSGRFSLSQAVRNSVVPDKADRANGLSILKQAARKGAAYEKVADSKRILGQADVLEMASNSRSFRRFLRSIGCASYGGQSRRPA
jgi:Domain of unknown function (DUF4276)